MLIHSFRALLVLLSAMAASCVNYAGTYKLSSAFENGSPVHIPPGNFLLQVREADTPNVYPFGIKIGNSLGSTFSVSGDDDRTVAVGLMRSTMMMPPPDMFELEKALSRIMPTLTSIQLEEDHLVLEGDNAVLSFQVAYS